MSAKSVVVVVLAFSLVSPRAHAWNELGHMVVTKLAWEQLDTRRQEAAYATLVQLPYFEKFMSERARPEGVNPKEWALLNASTWPDWLRDFTKTGKRFDRDISKYHVGPRHYINLSITAPDFAGPVTKPTDTEENIVNGIRASMRQLQDDAGSGQSKALALAWLLHLVGDIHQPLHCGSYFSKEYPQGDQGGNARWIRGADGPKNLHAYWDDLLGSSEGFGRAPFEKTAADRIWDRIQEQYGLLRGENYQRLAYGTLLERFDAMDWAKEGNELARQSVYTQRGTPIPGRPILNYYQLPADAKNAEAAKAPALPERYADAVLALARRQVALASHRLADCLRAALP
jgi:hypothetical protein